MLNKVLIPLDGSELSERAIAYGRQIIAEVGQIILLSVIDIPERVPMAFYPAMAPVAADDSLIEGRFVPQAEDYLNEQADKLRNAGLDVIVVTVVDDPASAIIRVAEEYDVDAIVMSTHGRSGLSRWLFGSVTSKVLSVVAVPVFVVPIRGDSP